MDKFENLKMNGGFWLVGYQYLKLSKWVLSVAITFSAVVGFYLNNEAFSGNIWFLIAGVFLLSSGASAINQYVERAQDSIMTRTRNRPLPSGAISPNEALIFSFITIVIGTTLLTQISIVATLLGIANVVLYDFVYTPLKYRSQFAILAGGLVGAIPPLMGWYASGAIGLESSIVVFATFMFVWQIPHFFLLLIKYRKEYELVNTVTVFRNNEEKAPLMFFIWFLATCIVSFMFPLLGILSFAKTIFLYVINIGLIALFALQLYVQPIKIPAFVYMSLHLFLLFHFILLIL